MASLLFIITLLTFLLIDIKNIHKFLYNGNIFKLLIKSKDAIMQNTWLIIPISLISYLIGSISNTRIISKIVDPEADLENVFFEDKKTSQKRRLRTVSATTASIKLGPKVGGLITLLDTLKGFIPVLIVHLLFPNKIYHLVAGIFVLIGHDWSIFYRFTGGGGYSTSNGIFFAVDWLGALICSLTGMGVGFMFLKDMFLAFMLPPWLMVLWFILFKRDWYHIIFGLAINIIILIKLSPDILDYFNNSDKSSRDYSSIMDQTGMGRGMKKLMKFLGVDPEK